MSIPELKKAKTKNKFIITKNKSINIDKNLYEFACKYSFIYLI